MSQPVWERIGQHGDVQFTVYGGGEVYRDTTGVYPPEAECVEPPEECEDEEVDCPAPGCQAANEDDSIDEECPLCQGSGRVPNPDLRWTVYRVQLERHYWTAPSYPGAKCCGTWPCTDCDNAALAAACHQPARGEFCPPTVLDFTDPHGILSDNKAHRLSSVWYERTAQHQAERPQDGDGLEGVARSVGMEGVTAATIREQFCSDDPMERFGAYEHVAAEWGWGQFDDEPLSLTAQEMEERYESDPLLIHLPAGAGHYGTLCGASAGRYTPQRTSYELVGAQRWCGACRTKAEETVVAAIVRRSES